MLILTGPQGAGNHLWSKILSLHPDVYGWKTLLDNYWEAHRFAEPFARHWKDHSLLALFDWSQSEYYFTSISCPLGIPDSDVNPVWMPDVTGFADKVTSLGHEVEIVVCGRDGNILTYQQERLRGESTFPMFMDKLHTFSKPTFLSYELLYLYRSKYLKSLKLNIPVAADDLRVDDILSDDANAKYIHPVDSNPLDNCNRTGTALKDKP